MLNDNTLCVFDVIMTYLTSGEYVVIAKNEVKALLPQTMSQSEISSAMTSLQTNELIKIRYMDNEVYCVAVLPKGILLNEKRKEEQKAVRSIVERLESVGSDQIAEDETEAFSKAEAKEAVANPTFSYKKAAIICGLTSFFGAFLGGLIAVIIILARLG